jgi:hypothetical protein
VLAYFSFIPPSEKLQGNVTPEPQSPLIPSAPVYHWYQDKNQRENQHMGSVRCESCSSVIFKISERGYKIDRYLQILTEKILIPDQKTVFQSEPVCNEGGG